MNDLVANPFAAPATSGRNTGGALAQTAEQRAIAEVQAALVVAQKFPRDEVQAMDRILNAFTRPSLAEVAKYQYSRGGSDVDGPSIRSAEAIAQMWGRIDFGFRVLSQGVGPDGSGYSDCEAFAWDIQSLTRRVVSFRVRHWRDTKRGGYPLTDERDIYELTANMAQRRVRACILGVIPGDVVEAAMSQAEVTLRSKADTSPEARQKLLDAFATFGVTKAQIEKRIQRRLDAIQPAQVVSLKKIYASLRDGMSTPVEWFEPEEQAQAPTPTPKSASGALDQFAAKAKPAPAAPAPAPSAEKMDAETGEVTEGQEQAVPEIPEDAMLAWSEEQKWMPAWKWISMNLCAMHKDVRAAFVAANSEIIDAVAAHNEKYAKAVRELMAQAEVHYGNQA